DAATMGVGTTITASTPPEACTLFGPDPPPGDFRPRDPDLTGGYYQPLLLRGEGPDAIASERIRCNLARAPVDLAREYRERYVANANPHLGASITARERSSGNAVELDELPPSAEIELEATIAGDAREQYLVLDGRALKTACEVLAISWFTTRGEFESR